ncbi:ABC transporter ATP-binding protein [Halomonas halocynthiae]|uniref:ABC transporter ATP-binding protein n=1 Tax=Halomonas halocynthiae TaxID=176290 RepID=UPI000421C356|nr:ABC transporter ATP-binding protein [Halomonas halocynthiae]
MNFLSTLRRSMYPPAPVETKESILPADDTSIRETSDGHRGLSIAGATKYFSSQAALSGVSLDIAPGEFIALLGPSGCGKTTMLRTLAGFEALSAGHITLNGRHLDDGSRPLPPEERNMGMVFQTYALWPHMSVADNVGYALKLQGIRGQEYQRRVDEALALVELAAYGNRPPQELSGGQRQRVALARCLVTSPEVVLLDEPLANLDRHLRAAMEDSFRDFHQRTQATLVYVTHDQGEAMSLADRIAVMRDGRLIQLATPEVLYRQPRTPWVADFIGQGSIMKLPGLTPSTTVNGEHLTASLRAWNKGQNTKTTHVVVRPEHVRLSPINTTPRSAMSGLTSNNGTDSQIGARVVSSIFRGERYEVHLRLADGTQLQAYSPTYLAAESAVGVTIQRAWCLEPDA